MARKLKKAAKNLAVKKAVKKQTPIEEVKIVEEAQPAVPEVVSAPVEVESGIHEIVPPEERLQGNETQTGDLPLPEEVKPVEVTPAPAKLRVENISQVTTTADLLRAVSVDATDAPVEKMAAPSSTDKVNIRILRQISTPPVIGSFDFTSSVGKDTQTGRTVRGLFQPNTVYRVPRYVADFVCERNWAMVVA